MPITASFLEEEDDRWILWFPVALGLGVALYFSLPREPSWGVGWPFLAFLGPLIGVFWRFLWLRRLGMACFAIAGGFCLSQWQVVQKDPLMLNRKLRGLLIAGEISDIEHLPSSKNPSSSRLSSSSPSSSRFMYRVILDKLVVLDERDNALPLPRRVRLTIRNSPSLLWTGQKIKLRASLSPLTDPVSPGGYDFRRQAFFKGIGAAGYSVTPPEILSSPAPSFWTRLDHLRHQLTRTFLKQMPEPTGALAAALITGDKASIPQEMRQQFADAGLAHILAISGLHLSIVAGLFFFFFQGGLALIPSLALRYPLHKISALLSLGGTGAYLILSGAGIPAQRAFIMTALVLIAILTDRKAMTLRLVSFAATLILILSPESLLSPSFQLSFSAVVALVAAYESGSEYLYRLFEYRQSWFYRIGLYIVGSLFSTLIASLATAPYTILTFHRFTLQGTIANLIAIPLTVFFLVPCAVVTCFLMPIQEVPFTLPLLSRGLSWLAAIAQEVSTWPGAVIPVSNPHPAAIPLITGGALWLCLWKTRWRFWGIGFMLMGVSTFLRPTYPHVWVDNEGKVIGFVENTPKDEEKVIGRVENIPQAPPKLFISSKGAGRFAVKNWLLEAGLSQIETFPYHKTKGKWRCDGQSCLVHIDSKTRVLLAKNAPQSPWCDVATVVISLAPLREACSQASVRIDKGDFSRFGSHGVWLTPGGPVVQTSRELQGERPWVR